MQLTLSAPALYSLELTPLCNNRCPGCFNVFIEDAATRPMHNVRPTLAARDWRVILEKIKPYASRLKLTGGEPTLHPEFEEIVDILTQLELSFSLFTNARWRNPARLLAHLGQTPQFAGFLISLHGASAEVHEAYSGVHGSFAETVENIQRATAQGFNVATSTVITRQNYNQLGAVIQLSAELGTDHAVINRYLGQPLPSIEPSEDELKFAVRAVDQLRRDGARVKFGNCVPQCFVENSSTGCLAGVAYCAISPWGEMRPCNHSPRVVGNVLTDSVETAWHSSEMDAWRGLMPTACESSCAAYSTCHGACRALIEIRGEQRDPLRGEPLAFVPRPSQRVTLYEGLRPLAQCHLRQEEFGMVLIRGNKIIPLPSAEMPLLLACDGSRSLREIEQKFGASSLRVVVGLHQKGLVQLLPAMERVPLAA